MEHVIAIVALVLTGPLVGVELGVAAFTNPLVAKLPDDAYRAGRTEVLRRFAARPVIFPDAAFAQACETKARDNLAREIASLRA